jgi:catechol 2,3-dioxygenase-like lactoylglutathione lyase family enzyme
MGFHHVAVATRDVSATHEFYTEAMGFELVKVEAAETDGGGWARHLFYDTHGQGLIAFWDIHDDENVPAEFEASLSAGLGLPIWTNHLAFDAGDLDGIEVHKRRWLDNRRRPGTRETPADSDQPAAQGRAGADLPRGRARTGRRRVAPTAWCRSR